MKRLGVIFGELGIMLFLLPSLSVAFAADCALFVNNVTNTNPLTKTFTVTGTNPGGSITKVSLNFGDVTEEKTSGGDIGSSAVNVPFNHTYSSSDTFNATATVFYNNSNPCNTPTKTITVQSGGGSSSTTVSGACPKDFEGLCKITISGNTKIVGTAVNILFIIAIVLAVLYLIWGGIRWITSGGDKGKIETARSAITASVVGLIVAFLALFIINFIIFVVTGKTDFLQNLKIPNLIDSLNN